MPNINKEYVPNDKTSVPNNKYYVPNNKKSDPNNKNSDPNNKKKTILAGLAPHNIDTSRTSLENILFETFWNIVGFLKQ